ncbi:MAG: FAD-dependent oxidoreductase [Ruminococcus sp.]
MESIWKVEKQLTGRRVFAGNISTDVAIIGGGMAGILTGYMLTRMGIKCTVLEKGKIGGGQTQFTTAKITMQQGTIYSDLLNKFGKETAEKYAKANFDALKNYDRIIRENNIKCHYEKCSSYIYTSENPRKILAESAAAQQLGIDCKLTKDTELPFSIKSALCFPNQRKFNPMEFIYELSKYVNILEDTKVLEIHKNEIHTNKGTVKAKIIVFACHIPFINFPGLYFAREHQERSYVIALENPERLHNNYYGIDKGGLSLRGYEDIILLGGSNHRTGQNAEGNNYTKLRSAAMQFYPDSKEIAHWSAQDGVTPDHIPYIGRFSKEQPNRYVATGFCKWGMTNSMISAQIISDYIIGKSNPYADIFSPSRFNMSCASSLCHELGKSTKGLAKSIFYMPNKAIYNLQTGKGEIITYKGKKCGAYRDEKGRCYLVNVKCRHLGCQLEWNDEDKTWDCPCHGSRYDYKGNVLDGPAQKGIQLTKI